MGLFSTESNVKRGLQMNATELSRAQDQLEKQIYFLSVRTNELLHQQALGFGKDVMLYAYANSPDNAKQIARGFVESRGLTVDKIENNPRPALNQQIEKYTFPEQIYGLPEDKFMTLMNQRKKTWPAEVVDRTIGEFFKKQAFLKDLSQEEIEEHIQTTGPAI